MLKVSWNMSTLGMNQTSCFRGWKINKRVYCNIKLPFAENKHDNLPGMKIHGLGNGVFLNATKNSFLQHEVESKLTTPLITK